MGRSDHKPTLKISSLCTFHRRSCVSHLTRRGGCHHGDRTVGTGVGGTPDYSGWSVTLPHLHPRRRWHRHWCSTVRRPDHRTRFGRSPDNHCHQLRAASCAVGGGRNRHRWSAKPSAERFGACAWWRNHQRSGVVCRGRSLERPFRIRAWSHLCTASCAPGQEHDRE